MLFVMQTSFLINWQLVFYVVVGSLCLKLKDNHNYNTLSESMTEIGFTRHNPGLDIMALMPISA